jgi:hypothetical protein
VKVFLSYGHDQNAPLVAGAALLDLDHCSHDLARAIDEKLRAGVQVRLSNLSPVDRRAY